MEDMAEQRDDTTLDLGKSVQICLFAV